MKTNPPFDGEIHAVSAKRMPDLNSPKREPGWFLGEPVPHHSEPARAGADAYDNMVAWMSMNAPYHHMMAFKAALERPASPAPAPATGGASLLRQLRALAIALHAKHYAEDSPGWQPLEDAEGILSQIDNMAAGLFRAALASPAATSAETQGGDGVREAVAICEQQALQYLNGEPSTAIGRMYQKACRDCAEAIRAALALENTDDR